MFETPTATVYRRAADGERFGAATVSEASERSRPGVFPDLEIDWPRIFASRA